MPAAVPLIVAGAVGTGAAAAVGTAIAGAAISTAAATAIGAGVIATGASLATGKDVGESLQTGVISGLTAGIGSSIGAAAAGAGSAADAAFVAADAAQLAGQGLSQAAIAQNLIASGVSSTAAQTAAQLAASGATESAISSSLGSGTFYEAPAVSGGAEVTPVQPPAEQVVTPIEGGLIGSPVPSAFDTAVNTALGTTPPIGQFGQTGTAGFGTALPPASDVAAGLTSVGISPGTAANLAGQTSAGVGATNLLGGATAAAPIAAPKTISIQDALRGARLVNNLLTPQQPQVPNMLGRAQEALAQQGGVDYNTLLGLLNRQASTAGLLGTRFQPQSINIASLLG